MIEESESRIAENNAVLAGVEPICDELLQRHFLRKHGHAAYHGQRS